MSNRGLVLGVLLGVGLFATGCRLLRADCQANGALRFSVACGKPVIACRGQGIDEIIQHGKNGWLIPVAGLNELVEGLSRLLHSPELCARIGMAARETILRDLTLSHQAERLARIYGEVIA